MNKVTQLSLSFGILILSFVFSIQYVYADVMNQDFLTMKCNPDEEEVVCSYSSEEPFGPRTSDGCKNYANNPDYRYLVSHGSSFGGEEKYCSKIVAQDEEAKKDNNKARIPAEENNYILPGVIIFFVIIISFVSLFLIKKKNVNK